MKRNEPISKIMSTDVQTINTTQKVSDARKIMADGGFHHLPVVSGKKLVGLITASDILGISVEGVGSDQRSMDAYIDHQFSVEGVMKKDLRTIGEGGTIRQAADLLADGDLHALPVIDGENLVGIVTSTDLIRYLRDL